MGSAFFSVFFFLWRKLKIPASAGAAATSARERKSVPYRIFFIRSSYFFTPSALSNLGKKELISGL